MFCFQQKNTEEIIQAYISKHNSDRENWVILLMIITDVEKSHCLAGKTLYMLLQKITSK